MTESRKVEGVVMDENNQIVFDPKHQEDAAFQSKARKKNALARSPFFIKLLSVLMILPLLAFFGVFAVFFLLVIVLFGRRMNFVKMGRFGR